MSMISSEKFVPHRLEHLTQAKVFPQPLPETFYSRMIADYNALDDVEVSRIIYESDGLKVTGLMALPKIIAPGAHPILIYNRGGNREYGKLTLLSAMRSMVPFARKGYLVFASNYRGNDGGEGEDEFGGADLHDVLNLLTLAREHSGFDSKNIYMIGHSRGAMMTYLSIRHGAPINAAVGIAGVADLRRAGQERPEMEKNVFSRLIPKNSDPETFYHARSAACWAGEMHVPLLLLHGDADEAVDVSHSIRLDEALQEAGCEHELVIYPGGNHALLRHWDQVISECLSWMERHTHATRDLKKRNA